MKLSKSDLTEIHDLLEYLKTEHHIVEDLGETDTFRRLKQLLTPNTHPLGNSSNLQNESDVSWERLISMRAEAVYGVQAGLNGMARVLVAIEQEINRRLLKYLPKEQ